MADEPKRILVLDTSIVLLLDGASSRHADGLERLLNLLDERKSDIFAVTAPGLAEAHGAPLPNDVLILDMNAHAARVASRLRDVWRKRMKAAKQKIEHPHMVKTDWMILGTAEAWRATAIYTEDDNMVSMAAEAGLKVEVRALPPMPKQPRLF